MQDFIVCPNCSKNIPLTEALAHQLDVKYHQKLEEQKKAVEERLNEEARVWREETVGKIEEKLRSKLREETELKLKDARAEREELFTQKKELQEQLLEMTKMMRQMKSDEENKKLEFEKKLLESQENIRTQEQQKIDEAYRLKLLEQDKKLSDALKLVDDYKRKLEQGSQQLQGEVLELELEHMLKREFPYDEIAAVAKGVRGGDLVQTVKNTNGKVCGTILWESKRTKAWSAEWIHKLKQDQRSAKAELAVIISNILPTDIKQFGCIDGIWVGSYEVILGIATALRTQLMEMTMLRTSLDGKQSKMEILYNYVYSTEFKHRVQAILETYSAIQDDMEREKRWFSAKWAKQEKMLRSVIDNTIGMSSEVQNITGKEVLSEPQIDADEPKIPATTNLNESLF